MCFDIWAAKTNYVPKCKMSSGPYGPIFKIVCANSIIRFKFVLIVEILRARIYLLFSLFNYKLKQMCSSLNFQFIFNTDV